MNKKIFIFMFLTLGICLCCASIGVLSRCLFVVYDTIRLPVSRGIVASSEVVVKINSRGVPLYSANVEVGYGHCGMAQSTSRILPFGNFDSSFEFFAKLLKRKYPIGAVVTVYLKSSSGGNDFIFNFGVLEFGMVGMSLLMLCAGICAVIYSVKCNRQYA